MQGSSSQDSSTLPAVIITDSVFTSNYGADFGGAIYMESVGVELRDVLLDSNACAPVRGLGGGLASAPSILALASVAASMCCRLHGHAGLAMPGLPAAPWKDRSMLSAAS